MKSPRDKGFYIYKDGTPMQVDDLIEALRTAISCTAASIIVKPIFPYEIKMFKDYKRKLEVLEKIKESYELAKAMSVKPKMRPVKKR